MQRNLQRVMQPVTDIQNRLQTIQVPTFRMPEYDAAVQRVISDSARFSKTIERLQLGSVAKVANDIAKIGRETKALDDAGWLPHYSTPFAIIDECNGDTQTLNEKLERHYDDNWQSVREEIANRIENHDIDDEAKATFREALEAHEAGLYRSVCRLLLPEIERVARKELHGDDPGGIASQHVLQELAGNIGIRSTEPRGLYGLNLFRCLTQHLYEQIKSEEKLRYFANSPIPNRHAAVHGLIVYSSAQNSLNTLFMTDYIFQVVTIVKAP